MAVQQTNSKIPRSRENDYTSEAAASRREFLRERTDVALDHVSEFSFDPARAQGNIENFIGVAQVPLGVAGPVLVNGERAQGEYYVPLATAEGTLVASYNRGMRLLREASGVTTTTTARTRPTGSPRSSSPPARTWPTWRNLRPPTTTASFSRTGISTSR